MSISVLIVHGHEIVRSGLRSMLEGSEVAVAGETVDADDALELTLRLNPDIVLMDFRFDNVDGLEALQQIRAKSPQTRVMILSTHDNPTYVARAVALGAKDYVDMSAPRDELLDRIRTVAADLPPSEDSIMHAVKEVMSQRKPLHPEFQLTGREQQVLRHLALGLSNREIGQFLEISVETVKEHVQNVLRKMNAVDRTQAAVWAVKRGLVN